MAGAAPAGAEVARRVGAAGGARTPSQPRPSPDESAFRPIRQTKVAFVQPARTNVAFVQPRANRCVLSGAATGNPDPAPPTPRAAVRPRTGTTVAAGGGPARPPTALARSDTRPPRTSSTFTPPQASERSAARPGGGGSAQAGAASGDQVRGSRVGGAVDEAVHHVAEGQPGGGVGEADRPAAAGVA